MSEYPTSIPDGIPSERDYSALIGSDLFRDMEQFSNSFLSAHAQALRDYRRRWVADPLHQWSRQWEYPYVASALRSSMARQTAPRILDAGSGVTFFPWYLSARLANANVSCCDYDGSLSGIYERINDERTSRVGFAVADMRSLPHDDQSMDAVYCVSVLEHTNAYERIIEELHRVLRPGGTLVVTFDISLDGTRDIDADRAQALLEALACKFNRGMKTGSRIRTMLDDPGIFTTLSASRLNRKLLPWQAPRILYQLKSLFTRGRLGAWPPPLTIYCLSVSKAD